MWIKGIIGFVASMVLFMPCSFAFSWQEDVDANTREKVFLYSIYQFMPTPDYKNTWSNVPGWSKVNELKFKADDSFRDTYRKDGKTDDGVIEEFRVDYDEGDVLGPEITFLSKDKKTISRICNYLTMRINLLTNQYKTREYDQRLHKVKENIRWKTSSPDGVTRYIGIYAPEKAKEGYYSVSLWKCKMIGID